MNKSVLPHGTKSLFGSQYEIYELLTKLIASPYEFHPTGSRALGSKEKIDSTTDYDFFVSSTPEVETFLVGLGFTQTDKNHSYHKGDLLLDKLFVKESFLSDHDREMGAIPLWTFHVQLVPPNRFVLKVRLQEQIESSGLCRSLSKSERRKLWRLALKMASAHGVRVSETCGHCGHGFLISVDETRYVCPHCHVADNV